MALGLSLVNVYPLQTKVAFTFYAKLLTQIDEKIYFMIFQFFPLSYKPNHKVF